MFILVKMDPDNAEIKKDAERSRKKLMTLVKKQEILLRGKKISNTLILNNSYTNRLTQNKTSYVSS